MIVGINYHAHNRIRFGQTRVEEGLTARYLICHEIVVLISVCKKLSNSVRGKWQVTPPGTNGPVVQKWRIAPRPCSVRQRTWVPHRKSLIFSLINDTIIHHGGKMSRCWERNTAPCVLCRSLLLADGQAQVIILTRRMQDSLSFPARGKTFLYPTASMPDRRLICDGHSKVSFL
jgi:hypothetical protein